MRMSSRFVLGTLIGIVLLAGPVWAQDRDVPAALRPYMSAEEFRAAGLHKLNPVELAQFQAWFVRTMRSSGEDPLARAPDARPPGAAGAADASRDELAAERRRLAEERRQLEEDRRALAQQRASQADGEGPAPAPAQTGFGAVQQDDGPRRLDARIVGTFNGWDGPTRIRLDNGQVWETVGGVRWGPRGSMENPAVIIRRGLFNSYTLQVQGYNIRVQVKRVE